jgi:hypothetical protein
MHHPVSRARYFFAATAIVVLASCSGDGGDPPPGIQRIEIASRQVTFEGKTFGAVGSYEKLVGKAFGELDPADPRNAVITDIALAPRNSRGRVEYSMDIYILKPTDLAKGNHKLFMEVNNRGGKLFGNFNNSTGGNDPTTAANAGGAFLMNQGYTLAWNGWDPSAPSGGGNLTITVPVAKNADGSPITGPSYEYIVFDNATTMTSLLAYKAATTDKSKATLTVRDHLTDAPVAVPSTGWGYTADAGSIQLLPAGTPFKQSAIYEFTYTATDPTVAGIGFAATRDFVSFLRHANLDNANTPNPVAGDITRATAFTISQPGRYMNDFVWLGFNQDEKGGKVFDGIENWIEAGDGVALNYRFSQSARTERNRQNHLYPEAPFPFAYTVLTDPLTGKTDGRNRRCLQTNTCPKIMQVNSANEYWVKAGSLVHTDTAGNDIADPDNVRFYLLSGVEHTVGGAPANSAGVCAQFRNTTDPNPALRALFVDMDQWIDGTAPPPSAVPRKNDGNVVFSQTTADSPLGIGVVPQASVGWPNIPGVLYTGLITVRNLFDFGPQFDAGIMANQPPKTTGKVYPSFVSKVDADGNEIAGVRLPPVAAPVATTSGWGLRATAFGGPDGCEANGQLIPFPATTAQRTASGDPRLSLEERYGTHAAYVAAVTAAANALKDRRLLLAADVDAYVSAAQASSVLAP